MTNDLPNPVEGLGPRILYPCTLPTAIKIDALNVNISCLLANLIPRTGRGSQDGRYTEVKGGGWEISLSYEHTGLRVLAHGYICLYTLS